MKAFLSRGVYKARFGVGFQGGSISEVVIT